MRHLSNKFAPAIMALSLMLGIGFALNVTVQAQRRPYRIDDRQIETLSEEMEANTDQVPQKT